MMVGKRAKQRTLEIIEERDALRADLTAANGAIRANVAEIARLTAMTAIMDDMASQKNELCAEVERLRSELDWANSSKDQLKGIVDGWMKENGPGGWIDALRAEVEIQRDIGKNYYNQLVDAKDQFSEVERLRAEVADAHALAYNLLVPRTLEDMKDTLDEQLGLLGDNIKRLRDGVESLQLDLRVMTESRDDWRDNYNTIAGNNAALREGLRRYLSGIGGRAELAALIGGEK
jgi:uncharacterized coiled-coil DUF342 family protein